MPLTYERQTFISTRDFVLHPSVFPQIWHPSCRQISKAFPFTSKKALIQHFSRINTYEMNTFDSVTQLSMIQISILNYSLLILTACIKKITSVQFNCILFEVMLYFSVDSWLCFLINWREFTFITNGSAEKADYFLSFCFPK